ncbi:MAG: DUF481 domain-containing protein, partial [Myxococcales bacterium]
GMTPFSLLLAALLAQSSAPPPPSPADAAESARRAADAAQRAAEAAQRAAEAAERLAGIAAKPGAPAATPAPVVAQPVVWSGTVALGLIALTGNSQTITFSTTGAFERKSPDWIWGIKAYAAYGQTTPGGSNTSEVTALNGGIQARGDRRFTEALSLYLLTGVDTDHLKSIESRPFGEAGVGIIWWDEKVGDLQKSTFRTDLGFRYGREYRFQYYPEHVGPTQDAAFKSVEIVAPRLGAVFRYAVNKDMIFTEDASVLGNVVSEARLIFVSTSKISTRLTDKVSLGAGLMVTDDTVPPKGKVRADTALTVGIEVGI